MGSGLLLVCLLSCVGVVRSAELPGDSLQRQAPAKQSPVAQSAIAQGPVAQGPSTQGSSREAALLAVRNQPLQAKSIDANVAGIVGLLNDPDPAIQNQALAVILWRPQVFVAQRQRMAAMVTDANQGCIVRALAALVPHLPMPIGECLLLAADNDASKRERGLRAVLAHGLDLAPRVQEVVALWPRRRSGEQLLATLQLLAEHDREAVLAAVRIEFAGLRHSSRREWQWHRAYLLQQLGAPEAEVEIALLAALPASRVSLPLGREYAAKSASFRAGLVKLCMSDHSYRQLHTFGLLEEVADKLAPHWPELANALTVPNLAGRVASLAIAMREQRPGVIDDLLAAVRKASPEVLGQLVPQALRCPDRAKDIMGAFSSRLTTAAHAGPAVIDVVFALGGEESLFVALPVLLASTNALVRARACQLAIVLGKVDQERREHLEGLSKDSDAAVRIEANHALRFVRGEVTDDNLIDQARDRDLYRVLQAYCVARRQNTKFSPAEAAAVPGLMANQNFLRWVHLCLREDLESGRITHGQLRPFLVKSPRWIAAIVQEAWTGTDVVAAADQAKETVAYPPLPQVVLELAAKNPKLREQLIASGRLSPDAKVPTLEELARQKKAEFAGYFRDLGDADPGVRSKAFVALQRRRAKEWHDSAKLLRRGGSAHQRRLLGVLMEQMDRYGALAALRAEEPVVMARGLQWFHQRVDAPGGMDDLRICAEQLLRQPDVWRTMVAESNMVSARHMAMLGADALPLLREAMKDARCHSRVLQALPWLGADAREFVPQLLRALRTRDCRAASLALLCIGLKPGDEHWLTFHDTVVAQWQQSDTNRRQELLPAICALGEGNDDFAIASIASLLRRRGGLLGKQVSEPIRAWVELGMRGDAVTRRRVAMLVVSARALDSVLRAGGRTPSSLVWQRAAAAPGLRIAMQEAVGQTSDEELRELLGLMLDAVASGSPAPATATIFAAKSDLVLRALVEDRSKSLEDPKVLQFLAEAMPVACVRWLSVAGPVSVRTASLLQYVPRSADVQAALARGMATVSARLRRAFCEALVKQGEASLPTVVTQLRAGGGRRKDMLAGLAAAGSAADYAVGAVAQGIADLDLVGQQETHRALLSMGSRGLGALLELLGEEQGIPRLEEAARSTDAGTAGAALRLLQQLRPEIAVRAARRQLYAQPDVRRWAGFILMADEEFLRKNPGGQAALLVKALGHDAEAIVRRRAAEGLLRMPTWSYDAAVIATELLSDPAKNVRMVAIRAFARHPDEVAASRVALEEALAAEAVTGLQAELRRVLEPQ